MTTSHLQVTVSSITYLTQCSHQWIWQIMKKVLLVGMKLLD